MGEAVNGRETPQRQREPEEERRQRRRRSRRIKPQIKEIYFHRGQSFVAKLRACNETMFVSLDFGIFARKPVQESILETFDIVYKPIASIDQSDLEFLIPADNETYIDPDIK